MEEKQISEETFNFIFNIIWNIKDKVSERAECNRIAKAEAKEAGYIKKSALEQAREFEVGTTRRDENGRWVKEADFDILRSLYEEAIKEIGGIE